MNTSASNPCELSEPRLAVDGGRRAVPGPLPGWPRFSSDEIQSVTRVLESGRVNYWTGTEGRQFEAEFASYFGRKHGIALANGTLALELALRACGIGPGDEVIVTPRSFIASASCVVSVGATPVFADVDEDSQNMTVSTITRAMSPRTRGIIAVHLAGWPCAMPEIMAFAAEHDITVIEDCAQSHGSRIAGRLAGSFGHFAAFSFCQDKIMTTGGEGGMLLMDDERSFEFSWSYKDHGKSRVKALSPGTGVAFRWLHDSFGTNWRLTEMQAAIGRLQLTGLARSVELRRANFAILFERMNNVPALRIPRPPEEVHHAAYRFYAFLRPERLRSGWSRRRVLEALAAEGVPCFAGSCSEIYLEEAFSGTPLRPDPPLPVAHSLGEQSLALLVHPTLTDSDMNLIADGVLKVMSAAAW